MPLSLNILPNFSNPGLDKRVYPAHLCVAAGILQPAELPHSDNAEHGEEAGAAPGQDVPHHRRDQHHLQGRPRQPAQGGRLRSWPVHGGSGMKELGLKAGLCIKCFAREQGGTH